MRGRDKTHLNQMNVIKLGRNWVTGSTWGEKRTQNRKLVWHYLPLPEGVSSHHLIPARGGGWVPIKLGLPWTSCPQGGTGSRNYGSSGCNCGGGSSGEPPPWSWPYSRRRVAPPPPNFLGEDSGSPGWHRHWAGLRTPLRSALENRSAPWAAFGNRSPLWATLTNRTTLGAKLRNWNPPWARRGKNRPLWPWCGNRSPLWAWRGNRSPLWARVGIWGSPWARRRNSSTLWARLGIWSPLWAGHRNRSPL